MNENTLARIADFIKDLLTPKKKVGDDTNYMSGRRGADLVSGKSTPRGWYESFMLEKYVKDTTLPGDPRRVQFSAENNLRRVINWTPLMMVILVAIVIYLITGGSSSSTEVKYPTRDLPKSCTVIRSRPIKTWNEFIETTPIVEVDEYRTRYSVLSGVDELKKALEGDPTVSLALLVNPDGVDVVNVYDPNKVTIYPFKVEGRKFYALIDNEWTQVYESTGNSMPRRPWFHDKCYILNGTNIIVRWE